MRRPALRPARHTPKQHPRTPAPVADFAAGDTVVYPSHGVGRVVELAAQDVGGISLPMIRIGFENSQATVCVPLARAPALGLRKLASSSTFAEALAVLRGKPVASKLVWARRAVDFEAKINSGNPLLVAEVLRDLRRNADPRAATSYSERQVFDLAARRLSSEMAAAGSTSLDDALACVTEQLQLPKTA